MPPSAGFIGKFTLFSAAVESGFYGLAVIAVLNSVLALAYYFRVARNMYMMDARCAKEISPSRGLQLSLLLLALATLFLGLYPIPFLHAAHHAGGAL